IHWQGADGDALQGAVLLPSDYVEGKTYPLIVALYPAPMSACVYQFGLCGQNQFPNKQLFATRGYAVLFPDAPLSSGNFFKNLVDAVLPGVNKIVDIGIADPGRIGVLGQSFGGYAALSLITQTQQFKAAVMISG